MATAETNRPEREPRSGNVQSVERAFATLEVLAEHQGRLGISAIAEAAGLSLPTIHRLLRTLVGLGYVRQDQSRRYALGPRLIRLGEISSKMLASWARPHLERLVAEVGESANLAMFDADRVVYLAHTPSAHSVRMFTEVGSRVMPHCTGVGKALLASMPWDQVQDIVVRTGMPARTANTITDIQLLHKELQRIQSDGYSLDEEENEIGVRCVAVTVPAVATRLGISVSGPSNRMTRSLVDGAIPRLMEAANAISRDLNYEAAD